jgi:hypothetical protein
MGLSIPEAAKAAGVSPYTWREVESDYRHNTSRLSAATRTALLRIIPQWETALAERKAAAKERVLADMAAE